MSQVVNNQAESRYEMPVDGHVAILVYRRDGTVLHLVHTEVPPQLEGRGLASRLVQGALDDIRAKGETIVPRCSYVTAWLQRHPAYRDLIA